jgi:hypothetical protein
MASIRKYDQDVTVSSKLRTLSVFWCWWKVALDS